MNAQNGSKRSKRNFDQVTSGAGDHSALRPHQASSSNQIKSPGTRDNDNQPAPLAVTTIVRPTTGNASAVRSAVTWPSGRIASQITQKPVAQAA